MAWMGCGWGGGWFSGFPAQVEKEHPSQKTSSSGGGGTLSPLDQSSSPTAPVTIRSRSSGRGGGAGPYASRRASVVSPTGSHVPNPTAPLSRVGAVRAHPLSLRGQWLLFLGPVAAPPTPQVGAGSACVWRRPGRTPGVPKAPLTVAAAG